MAHTFKVAGPSKEMYQAGLAIEVYGQNSITNLSDPKILFDEVGRLVEDFSRADLKAASEDPAASEYLAALNDESEEAEAAVTAANKKFVAINHIIVRGVVRALRGQSHNEMRVLDDVENAFGDMLNDELIAMRASESEPGVVDAFERGVYALTARRLWGLINTLNERDAYKKYMMHPV